MSKLAAGESFLRIPWPNQSHFISRMSSRDCSSRMLLPLRSPNAMRTRDDVEGNSWLQQIETIRGQLRDAIRNAKVIEMMADDAKEPPTDKWFGSPSRWVN